MRFWPPARLAALAVPTLACGLSAPAQQLIGYVPTRDANVTGATDEVDGRAVLAGSVSVTAKDHTAPVTLSRGGTVRVCQTSRLHITESREITVTAPLLFSLDRGAIEIQTQATASDSILTPDLRFTVRGNGPLDLHLRVADNGDTCVDNRGSAAPTLAVSDPFGSSLYELGPGQHVLFEHGSLRDVVDSETSPCGCPNPKGESLAEAMLHPLPAKNSGPATDTPVPVVQAAAQHPFPQALSEGLEPPPEVPPAPATQPQMQVAGALVYNAVMADPDALDIQKPSSPEAAPAPAAVPPPAPAPVEAAAAPPPAPAPAPAQAAQPVVAPPPEPANNDLVHVIARAFRKLFGHH